MQAAARRGFAALWANIGFICAAAVLCYCLVRAFDPPRLNWGDSGSDYNVMTSGRNFARHGFVALRFTPHLLDPADMTRPRDGIYLYTHYPQLPDLMNGVLRKVFGFTKFVQFRMFALLLSFGSLFFIYQLARGYWSRTTAQVALALWVVNPLWIQHADYLHHIPYGAFFGFGSAWSLTRHLKGGRTRWLALSAVQLFLVILSSYDWWFFGPILVAAITVGHYRALRHREAFQVLAILATSVVAAVTLKFASNAWALGGLDKMLEDLSFQFRERASDQVAQTNYKDGIWRTAAGRVDRFFTPLLFVVTAFWCLAPLLRKRLRDRGFALPTMTNPLVLLLAALPFLGLFVEIWVGQYYPGVMIIPFYAVGSAAIIALLLAASTSTAARVAGGLMFIVLLASSIDEDARFPIAYFDPAAIASLGPQLDSVSPHEIEVLVNHPFDAPYRYFFRRRTMPALLIPRGRAEQVLRHLSDNGKDPDRASAAGSILVQHKHLTAEMYDKGYYQLLGKYHAWTLWGNPRKYRAELDAFVASGDSALIDAAARIGRKLYETNFYVIWRIDRPGFGSALQVPPAAGSR